VANDLFPLGPDTTQAAFGDINHLLRPGHLKQLAAILDDPEATENDRFVAFDLLKNANIAAGGVLPMCQDTGTAIIMGKKGRKVWTDGGDDEALAKRRARRLHEGEPALFAARAAVDVRGEEHQDQPAGPDRHLRGRRGTPTSSCSSPRAAARPTRRSSTRARKSLLTHDRMVEFLREKILTLGTAACPPYHLAIVIGGTSAEMNLKTVKLASTRYLDELPTSGSEHGHAFRDLEMEPRSTS
jgi:fumarate hydratase class I